jgi:hypothetical protein
VGKNKGLWLFAFEVVRYFVADFIKKLVLAQFLTSITVINKI